MKADLDIDIKIMHRKKKGYSDELRIVILLVKPGHLCDVQKCKENDARAHSNHRTVTDSLIT